MSVIDGRADPAACANGFDAARIFANDAPSTRTVRPPSSVSFTDCGRPCAMTNSVLESHGAGLCDAHSPNARPSRSGFAPFSRASRSSGAVRSGVAPSGREPTVSEWSSAQSRSMSAVCSAAGRNDTATTRPDRSVTGRASIWETSKSYGRPVPVSTPVTVSCASTASTVDGSNASTCRSSSRLASHQACRASSA